MFQMMTPYGVVEITENKLRDPARVERYLNVKILSRMDVQGSTSDGVTFGGMYNTNTIRTTHCTAVTLFQSSTL